MAQAYEYTIVQNTNDTTFLSDLATADAAGWEVIGYNSMELGVSVLRTALLRRRV